MSHDCRHFECIACPGGDTISRCAVGLAPEAPWRCPTACSEYETHPEADDLTVTMLLVRTQVEPPGLASGRAAAVLDDLAEHLERVGPSVVHDVRIEQELAHRRRRRGWLFGR